MPVFQSNIGLDDPDPDTQFSRLPNPNYQCSKWVNISQCGLLCKEQVEEVTVIVSYFETKHKWGQDQFYFYFTILNILIVSLCLLYHCYNGYTSQVQNINKSIYTK